ncbi:MAG: TIGR01459 family HAD-type hydrolase, partial [Pseudomonadota bacterium]
MDAPRIINGLGDIAADYDALLCDAWGVIHNGRELYPGASKALSSFKEQCGPVIVLTNAPRLSHVIPGQLDRLGLPRTAYDGVVTSGDATREAVVQLADKKFYRIGPDKDDGLFGSVDITMTSFDEAEVIFCSGPNNDSHETPEDYRGLLKEAVDRGMPMVCANPDIVVKFGDRLIYCAGALGQLHEELGGKVILGGKPHAPIYELAKTQMTAIKGEAPKRV